MKKLSVRVKVILVCLLAGLLSVIFISSLFLFLVSSYVSKYSGYGNSSVAEPLGIFSIYSVQWNTEFLLGEVVEYIEDSHENGACITDCFESISEAKCYKDLLKSGTSIAVFVDSINVFITDGCDYMTLMNDFEAISDSADISREPFITSNTWGLAMLYRATPDTGETVDVIAVNQHLNKVIYTDIGSDFKGGLVRSAVVIGLILLASTIVITLLFCFLMMKFMSKNFVRPVNELNTATKEIKDGNLEYNIKVYSDDELGEVCRNFDDMRKQLKSSIEMQRKYEGHRREMIAGISHDLATPITTIKGYASGILEGVAKTDEKKMHYLQTILNTANSMDRFVSELSFVSKFEYEDIEYEIKKADLVELIGNIVEESKPLVTKKNVSMSFDCGDISEAPAMIDSFQFTRVIRNLINNSIKYRKSEDELCCIDIRLGKYSLDESKVLISVDDNGIGVSDDELDKIFDIFYRADTARSNTASGNGLGLSISHQIITKIGGKIWADHSESGGLSVYILLSLEE